MLGCMFDWPLNGGKCMIAMKSFRSYQAVCGMLKSAGPISLSCYRNCTFLFFFSGQ